MTPLDQRAIEHARQTLAKGMAALPSDEKNGLYWVKSGLLLRATVLLRVGAEEANAAINELVETLGELFLTHGVAIPPSEQINFVFLSLFVRNRPAAKLLASLPIDQDDKFEFTLALRHNLAQLLSVHSEHFESVAITPLEAAFLGDIQAIARKTPTDLSATDKFWSSLRRKRFANTIFEYKNIFRGALEFARDS